MIDESYILHKAFSFTPKRMSEVYNKNWSKMCRRREKHIPHTFGCSCNNKTQS